MDKKILHISWQFHWFLGDLLDKREKDILIVWSDINLIKEIFLDYDFILFHFIKDLDLKSIFDIVSEKKTYWLFVHDFYPFCSRWNLSINSWQKCNVIDSLDCNCWLIKYIDINNYSLFFKNMTFLLWQDLFTKNYFLNISNYYNYSFKINYIKQFILKNKILSKKKDSDFFRIWFVWIPSEIKWFWTILNMLSKLDSSFLINNKIIFNFYSITNFTKDNSNLMKKIEYKDWYVNYYYNENNRKNIYSNIDCLLVTSMWNENWPMPLYEAFANKIPVIISDQESLKEKVIDRVDSYVFKTWDERDLLKWILWIKKNYEKVISNKEWFRYNTIENFNKQLTNFLNEL